MQIALSENSHIMRVVPSLNNISFSRQLPIRLQNHICFPFFVTRFPTSIYIKTYTGSVQKINAISDG